MGFILSYFVIVFLVIEIAVVLMRSTGLDHDISRFQVVSLMTSTGFTTKESELILSHPVRRKIGIFLILFGIFSFAVVISALSTILVEDFTIVYLVAISAGLLFLLLVVRIPFVYQWLMSRFHKPLENKYEVHELPIEAVLLQEDSDVFLDIPVGEQSPFVGQTLDRICGADQDVNLLFIKRGTVQIRRERCLTPLEAGDVLYLFGSKRDIDRIFAAELTEREKLRRQDLESKNLI